MAGLISDFIESIVGLARGTRVAEVWRTEFEVTPNAEILVESDAGSIQIAGGEGASVRIEAEKYARNELDLQQMEVGVERSDQQVRVFYRAPSGFVFNRGVDFRITAPSGCKPVLATRGGSVKVIRFESGARASTAGGSIQAVDVAGELELKTSGGSVTAVGAEGAVVADTSGGSIKVSGQVSSARLRTSGGSIKAEGIKGCIDATTSGGSIQVAGRLTGTNRLQTSGGSIAAYLPQNTDLKVDAKGTSAASDFPLERNRGQLTGNIGDGSGGTLTMRTGGGSVRIVSQAGP